MLTIGVYTIELHLPGAQSLKEKRQILRRIKDRLRSRYNISVAEMTEHADLWQRGGLALVAVGHGRDALERLFETLHAEIAAQVPGHLVETGRDFLHAADGGSEGWDKSWE